MTNANDYLKWRGDLSFANSPINEVDNILFVFLAYLNLDGIVPKRAEDGFVTMKTAIKQCLAKDKDDKSYYGAVMPNEDIRRMANLMATSRRFSNVKLTGYVNEINDDNDNEFQFSAYTAVTDDGTVFISFKGTDDSLAGWKEDLNMSFCDSVPGQHSAVKYFNEIAASLDGDIIVGGHSKGGNFAVYAAANCERKYQDRIKVVYNNDGPGFGKAFLESEGYLNIKSKVVKFVPQESVVGMLLGNDDNYTVINSGGVGVFQHNSYLWEVMGCKFVRRSELEKTSSELNRIINTWIEDKDIETRKAISEALYSMMKAGDAKTITDITHDKTLLWKALMKVAPEKRGIVFKAFTDLIGTLIVSSVPSGLKSKTKENKGENKDEKTGD